MAVAAEPPGDAGGDEVGGVDAGHDADEHGQREIVDDGAAEEDEGAGGEEAGAAGEDGAGEREVEAAVDDFVEAAFFAEAGAFADAVEDDDFVVDGVTGDGEKRADEREGELAAEGGHDAEGDEDVVELADGGGDGVGPFEADGGGRSRMPRRPASRAVMAFWLISLPTWPPMLETEPASKPAWGKFCWRTWTARSPWRCSVWTMSVLERVAGWSMTSLKPFLRRTSRSWPTSTGCW